MASEKFGDGNADSNSLCQAIKNNIAIFHGILDSDRFILGFFELLEADFIFLMPNRLLADRLGMTVEALAGRRASELGLPAGSIEKWVATLRQCREKRTTVNEEFFSDYRGRDTWHQYSLNYIEGSGSLFFCAAVDITESKQAGDGLRKSEEKYRLLAESAQDMIYIVDRDFRVKYANRLAAGALGGTPVDLIGKPLEALFPEENALQMKEGLRRVMDSGKPETGETVHRFRHRDIPMHVILTPFRDEDGKASGFMGISRDITDRKTAEEALQESERTKQILMDGIPESLLLLDRNGTILDANSVLARMLGKSKKELIGAYAYDFLDQETAGRRKCIIEEVFRTGLPARFEDARAGTYFENIVTPVLATDGKVEKVAIIALDITERKRGEAALRDAKLQAELYLDLLGHDINNMHQIALGYLELARDGHLEYLDKPIEVLHRSARLIKNVRKLQKLREDTLGSELMDVPEVLAEVQREYTGMSGNVITLDLNGHERCPVRANELLHDVFANLVSNAVKHTGDRTEIAIILEMNGKNGSRHCCVSVEDDGPGIPDDIKDRIFNRMLKGTTRAKGMGLGLYLVRSLVESYGGRTWVEDRVPGDHTKGAKFVVMLPVAE